MSEIYSITEKKKLDVVSNPIEKSHGLPNACYTSEKYTQLHRKKLMEKKRIFQIKLYIQQRRKCMVGALRSN